MAPGNIVSEAYDPEFGTSGNAHDLKEVIADISKEHFDPHLGGLKNIIEIVHGDDGENYSFMLSEREMRIIRFCLIRAYEDI